MVFAKLEEAVTIAQPKLPLAKAALLLTFLHISDTHISGDPPDHARWKAEDHGHPNHGVEALLDAIKGLPFEIDFILHTGDVCNDPGETNYHCARELLLRLPGPIYLLPGNHDSVEHMLNILHDGRKLRVLRDDHVEISGLHLVALDSTDCDSHLPSVAESQVQWLAARMDAIGDQPTIVALHHMPVPSGIRYFDDKMRPQIGDRIHNVLKPHGEKLAGVFYGHIHLVAETYRDGVLYICCPSTYYNNFAYPGLPKRITDPDSAGGFNLVMIGRQGTFLRRCNLPRVF